MSAQSITRHALAASCLLAISANALAAPFWTGYAGTIANSTIPAIKNGETYSVNLIFDNGGDTASNQTWTQEDLKCMVWYMNDNQNVMFVLDLTKPNANFVSVGEVSSNSNGRPTSLFTLFGSDFNGPTDGFGPGSYVGQGLSGLLTAPHAGFPMTGGENNPVFIAGHPGTYENSFGDASGQISVDNFYLWATVQPFTGWGIEQNPRFANLTGCLIPEAPPAANTVTPVPALGIPALALLGLGAAALGGLRLRRKESVSKAPSN